MACQKRPLTGVFITYERVQFWFVGVNVLLTMLVPIVLALLAQRYIIRGLTLGALKG